MKIAMIPARGGSKRIPKKNVKSFCGQPIINYSIDAARKSGIFDHIICSTDCEEIAQIAREAGAEIPFMRPANIADDFATTMDVIAHTLTHYESIGHTVESICCIYATAPFVRASDLQDADNMMNSELDFIFTATEFPFPIQRAFLINENERVSMFMPEHFNTRSQDLVEAYHDAGQFYFCQPEAVRQNKPIFGLKSKALLLDRMRVQDIDTPQDWVFAEALFALQKD